MAFSCSQKSLFLVSALVIFVKNDKLVFRFNTLSEEVVAHIIANSATSVQKKGDTNRLGNF